MRAHRRLVKIARSVNRHVNWSAHVGLAVSARSVVRMKPYDCLCALYRVSLEDVFATALYAKQSPHASRTFHRLGNRRLFRIVS